MIIMRIIIFSDLVMKGKKKEKMIHEWACKLKTKEEVPLNIQSSKRWSVVRGEWRRRRGRRENRLQLFEGGESTGRVGHYAVLEWHSSNRSNTHGVHRAGPVVSYHLYFVAAIRITRFSIFEKFSIAKQPVFIFFLIYLYCKLVFFITNNVKTTEMKKYKNL